MTRSVDLVPMCPYSDCITLKQGQPVASIINHQSSIQLLFVAEAVLMSLLVVYAPTYCTRWSQLRVSRDCSFTPYSSNKSAKKVVYSSLLYCASIVLHTGLTATHTVEQSGAHTIAYISLVPNTPSKSVYCL